MTKTITLTPDEVTDILIEWTVSKYGIDTAYYPQANMRVGTDGDGLAAFEVVFYGKSDTE